MLTRGAYNIFTSDREIINKRYNIFNNMHKKHLKYYNYFI